jgi:glycerol-3-phosphate dehydrogenase
VYAKVVLNATGPFADGLRKLSNPSNASCLKASSGSHITLPGFYGSGITGMIIPKTKVSWVGSSWQIPWNILIKHIKFGKCSWASKTVAVGDRLKVLQLSLEKSQQ